MPIWFGLNADCFRYSNQTNPSPRPKDKVIVRIRLDGTYAVVWKGKPLLAPEIQIPKNGQPDTHVA
jgi:hypothetical protein